MTKNRLVSLMVAGALALVGIGGVFTYSRVSAQATTSQATEVAPSQQSSSTSQVKAGRLPGGAQDSDLAAALGITLEQLQTAYQTANTEALKEAVSSDLITQAQADQMLANGLPTHFLRGIGNLSSNGIDYDGLLAKALGITTDQLQAARQQVLTSHLDAAVASGQMTQAQADEMKARNALAKDAKFQASMKDAFEASVDQAVTDGVITQSQADLIIKNNAAMGFLGGSGGHGGHGGHGGPDGFSSQTQPAIPSTSSGN